MINVCHYSTIRVIEFGYAGVSSIFNIHMVFLQKTGLIQDIEKLTFWAGESDKVHYVKQKLLYQINNLDIAISAKGFFIMNRQFLAGVIFRFSFLPLKDANLTRISYSTVTDGYGLLYLRHYFHSIFPVRERPHFQERNLTERFVEDILYWAKIHLFMSFDGQNILIFKIQMCGMNAIDTQP